MVNVCFLKLTPNCSNQINAGFIKADRQTFLTWQYLLGDSPNIREYSRLKWDKLS